MNVNCGPQLPAGEKISPFYHTYLPRRVLSADECSVLHRIENKLSYRPRSKSRDTTGDIRRCALILFKLRTETKENSLAEELSHKKEIGISPTFFQCHLMLCVCCAFCHLAAGPVVVVSSVGVP